VEKHVEHILSSLAVALALVLTLPSGSFAQAVLPQTVRLHLVSWHDRGGYDNANLGMALRWSNGLVAGGFNNSLGRASWYGGLIIPAFERRALRLELMAGAITGYSTSSPVDLVAVPSLGWRLSPRNTLQVVFMPRLVISANAVHVMVERRLGAPER
jgi:hypothetical protein